MKLWNKVIPLSGALGTKNLDVSGLCEREIVFWGSGIERERDAEISLWDIGARERERDRLLLSGPLGAKISLSLRLWGRVISPSGSFGKNDFSSLWGSERQRDR